MNGEEKSGSEVKKPPRRKWRRRVKNFFVALSAFFCLAAMVAWGFGIWGWGFVSVGPRINQFDFEIYGWRGGVEINAMNLMRFSPNRKAWSLRISATSLSLSQVPADEMKRCFIQLQFSPSWRVVLPYWLLILLFALAPALWWRRRYVERRQKQFFAQSVAAKRAEQQDKESNGKS